MIYFPLVSNCFKNQYQSTISNNMSIKTWIIQKISFFGLGFDDNNYSCSGATTYITYMSIKSKFLHVYVKLCGMDLVKLTAAWSLQPACPSLLLAFLFIIIVSSTLVSFASPVHSKKRLTIISQTQKIHQRIYSKSAVEKYE